MSQRGGGSTGFSWMGTRDATKHTQESPHLKMSAMPRLRNPELEDDTGDVLVLSTSICVIPLVVSVYIQFCWHLDTRGCQVK